MVDLLQHLGYRYIHSGTQYVVVPMGLKELDAATTPNKDKCLCPIASARGVEASSAALFDCLTFIMSRSLDYAFCPQCEGVWFFAEGEGHAGQLHHISGDTLARYDNLISPMRLEHIMQALTSDEPPKENYRNDP